MDSHPQHIGPSAGSHRLENTIFLALIGSLAMASYTIAGAIF
jgi:hypothetical protein